MSLLSRVFTSSTKRSAALVAPEREILGSAVDVVNLGARLTNSGVVVTAASAMGFSAVSSATRILSESVAQLPCFLYERTSDDSRERATGHPLYSLLHDAPNGEMDAFEFWEMAVQHLILWGNFYAELVVDGRGQVTALWPLNPRYVDIVRNQDTGELEYWYTRWGRELVPFIFHVRGMAGDGVKGVSLLAAARQAIGLGLAAEEFGARFFGNGAQPGLALVHPGKLGPEARKNLKDSWDATYSGVSNAHRVAVLEEGLTIERLGIPPDDAQFLETRKFQVVEIARIFRVPPHMMADLDHATFSNIEHQSLEFVTHSLGPWLKRLENAIRVQLLDARERRVYYAEFLVEGFLRGDIESRFNAYATARQWGWMSRNDVRRLENLNPIDGGDDYLVPMNMMTLEQMGRLDAQVEEGVGVRGSRFKVEGSKFKVEGSKFKVEGSKFKVQGSRSDVEGSRFEDGGSVEERAEEGTPRAAVVRHRLAGSYERVIADVAQRLVNREVNDVGNAAKRIFSRSEAENFVSWLKAFYARDNFAAVIFDYLLPVMSAYGDLVLGYVGEELGQEVAAEDLQDWIARYLRSRSDVWSADHRRALEDAAAEGYDAVTSELDAMKSDWAAQFARDQAYRFNNGLAVEGYMVAGRTAKKWIAFGDSCPYCNRLNGKVVEVKLEFLSPGQGIEDDDGGRYVTHSRVTHAPLHSGCDCMVVAA